MIQSTRTVLDWILEHWEKHGFGTCIVTDKKANNVGIAGLKKVVIQGKDVLDLGMTRYNQIWCLEG